MSKRSAYKCCDLCYKIVAEKSLLFHTVEDYVTVRLDERPGYVNQENNTVASKLHYCRSCWHKIVYSAQKAKEAADD